MSEGQKWFFEPTFNRSIKVRQKDQRLTSDAGVLLLREADHRLGLVTSLAKRMTDPRDPAKVRYTLAARRVWVPPPRHAFLREVLRL